MPSSPASKIGALLGIGILGGLLSGVFGIGGGVVMVPLIARVLRYEQRKAAATSLAAVFPAAVAGTIGYASEGHVAWEAGAIIALGGALGALVGTRLLKLISNRVQRYIFVVAMVGIGVATLLEIPSRDAVIEIGWTEALVSLAIGLGMGVASGLLGIGGGVIVIPSMILLLGASDVMAKGTSLLAMVPTSMVGTISNARSGLVDLREGLTIGISAAVASYPGVLLAHLISPQVATYAYVGLVILIIIVTLTNGRRARRG